MKGVPALEQAKKCIDSCVKSWGMTSLSEIELWFQNKYEVGGMVQMAMYFLEFDDYCELKQYIYDQYGYDVGGCNTKYDED